MTTKQKNLKNKPATFTLLLLIALGTVAAVLFTPAIPAIKGQFNLTLAMVQWTVSIFLLGYAGGQIIYAPIANRIGRKPTIYLASIVGIFGTLLCAIAGHIDSFYLLVVARFIMAIGTSVGLVLTLIIINDVYNYEQSRKIIASVTLAFAIFPGIAIFIGGFLVNHFAWESCFYFIAVYNFFVLLLCVFLPETGSGMDLNALKLEDILNRYYKTSKNSTLINYASMWGLCSVIIYVFAASAPIICISIMGMSPAKFGVFNLFTSAGYIVGTTTAREVSGYISSRRVMFLGLLLMTAGCLTLLFFCFIFLMLNIWELFISVFIIFIGMPMVFTNASALATKNVSDKATGSSILSFITMIFAVVSIFLMGMFHGNLELIMSEVFAIITFMIWILFYFTRNTKTFSIGLS